MTAIGTFVSSKTDRYEVLERLGEGGSGSAFVVRSEGTGRELVLKQLHLRDVDRWKAVERFEREATTLESLDHPGIPRFIEHFGGDVDDGDVPLCLVMQRAPGRTLQSFIDVGETVPPERFIAWLEAGLEVLHYLHKRVPPVIHRDLSPRNLIVDGDALRFVDFGAVKLAVAADSSTVTTMGTFGYMAPEQIMGQATAQSDLYSLAMSFVALANGCAPDKLQLDDATGRVDVNKALVAVPSRARAVLEDMLAPGLQRRLGSAQFGLNRLKRAPARPVHLPVPKPGQVPVATGKPWVALTLSAVVLATFVFGFIASLIPYDHQVGALGGWFSGHGNGASAVTGTLVDRPKLLTRPAIIRAVAFSPDGTRLVSYARDGLRTWTVPGGEEEGHAKPLLDDLETLWFSTDGKTIAAKDATVTWQRWDADDLGQTSTVQVGRAAAGRHQSVRITDCWAMTRKGDAALCRTAGAAFLLQGKQLDRARFALGRVHQRRAHAVFSDDGTVFATTGIGDDPLGLLVRLYESGDTLFKTHLDGASDLVIDTKGDVVAVVEDRAVRVVDAMARRTRCTIATGDFALARVALSPDGTLVAMAKGYRSSGGRFHLYNAGDCTHIAEVRGHARTVTALAFSPDNNLLATGGYDQVVRLWDVKSLR